MASIMQRLIENFAVMNAWFVATFVGALGKPVRRNVAWLGQRALAGNHNNMGMFLDDLTLEESSEGKKYDVKFVIEKDKLDKKMERLEDRRDHQKDHRRHEDELGHYMDYGWDDDVEIDDIDTIEVSYKKKDNKRVRYAKIIVDDIKKDGDDYKITGDFDRSRDEIFGELEDARLTFHLDNFNRRYDWQRYGRVGRKGRRDRH